MADMGYLISHIFFCLLIAAIIGGVIGWMLRQWTYRDDPIYQIPEPREATTLARNAAVAGAGIAGAGGAADDTGYDVQEIEGIGRVIGERLRGIGIGTTHALLQQCRESERRAEAARAAHVEESVMAQWVCAADLLRVAGINGQYAELLETSGIGSVQDLASADSEALHERLTRINAEQRRAPQLPRASEVAAWIDAATHLPRML